ncbi:hypothetical protein N7508_008552 [Penicillium antarcticum]|uniref:uncharacterized protein n=1 Tax=Penicillium antarcticum TaxID=416450 RepID=UPI00239ED3DD|nr:uncharacterized protein N7508_008552 [Penicillium antarcticum]KAJ5293731.1 hypothetical protein N7508_008552 [Penicillium antarcticum]
MGAFVYLRLNPLVSLRKPSRTREWAQRAGTAIDILGTDTSVRVSTFSPVVSMLSSSIGLACETRVFRRRELYSGPNALRRSSRERGVVSAIIAYISGVHSVNATALSSLLFIIPSMVGNDRGPFELNEGLEAYFAEGMGGEEESLESNDWKLKGLELQRVELEPQELELQELQIPGL